MATISGCTCIDLSAIARETAGTLQDVWLPLCDAPAPDGTTHKAMRLFTLKSNPKRGKVSSILHVPVEFRACEFRSAGMTQVHVVVQRLHNPKAGSSGGSQISSEAVRTSLKSLNPRQQKLLQPLLELENEMARFVIMSRSVMSNLF